MKLLSPRPLSLKFREVDTTSHSADQRTCLPRPQREGDSSCAAGQSREEDATSESTSLLGSPTAAQYKKGHKRDAHDGEHEALTHEGGRTADGQATVRTGRFQPKAFIRHQQLTNV